MISRSQLRRFQAQGGMITLQCADCGCSSQTKNPWPTCLSCDSAKLELVSVEKEAG